jgi:hypothetical protein
MAVLRAFGGGHGRGLDRGRCHLHTPRARHYGLVVRLRIRMGADHRRPRRVVLGAAAPLPLSSSRVSHFPKALRRGSLARRRQHRAGCEVSRHRRSPRGSGKIRHGVVSFLLQRPPYGARLSGRAGWIIASGSSI